MDSNTVTFMGDGFKDRVSKDRAVKAPCMEKENRVRSAPKQTSSDNNRAKAGSSLNSEEDEAGKKITQMSVDDLIFEKNRKHSQWGDYKETILRSPRR